MEPLPERDTIAAIATPPGRGGIGVLRLSGPGALRIAAPLLGRLADPLQPGRARFCHVVEPATGERLDESVVTFFEAPRSYSGEDTVEIAAHGSPVLLDHLLRLTLAGGARLAAPGEFTERAFLNGRLDLTQAEAVRDLIEAETIEGAQLAARQLGGALSRVVAPLKGELVTLIAALEAGIDFAEDDTPVLGDVELLRRLTALHEPLLRLAASYERGHLLRAGVRLAIVGRPNAGKSSLFNRLLERNRAIVTAEPGTTRDTVQERLSLGGVPVELIDTAGLREAGNEAERIGIARSREALADAGLVLVVLDGTKPLSPDERAMLQEVVDRPLLVALNKADLPFADPDLTPRIHELVPKAVAVVQTSAVNGTGMAELRAAMVGLVTRGLPTEPTTLTTLRQQNTVAAAAAAVAAATLAAQSRLPHELILLDLYGALRALDELTGATTPDDVLRLIFSTFCIGK